MLSEILPYLEVEQSNQDEIEKKVEITTPDIKGKTIEEAEKILKENELEIHINNEYEGIDKANTIVANQLPQAGIQTYSGSCVYIDF
ncbi:MAG: PASTA domain-containing protein [Clostridia bacterium]|nr:PASTA domain-containing protein [Clostridia bacterium]